ncbi:UbiX family flavin prenyltransferase [Deinococcus roseus]|uniref:Flavin prenyltransferase UbiX n=1 Tax=Deinococcus roseus TaxID=392414 RepID=A0ABQ2CVF0_9DEIO|nr:UbiX family flavin prenyltransferase [Deinococcus roseus]GGJ24775.1 flavin prenyltransferase UbiX [Deinococcus roseus]
MKLVIGVTGGSGAPYTLDLLRTLKKLQVPTHLVVSEGAKRVWETEGTQSIEELLDLATEVHDDRNLAASIASGSHRTLGMVVVPCSSSTLAKVALGLGDNLISRAAHVTLKERRTLVLVPREAPYPRPMLENMLRAHDAGAVILPASPGFYSTPEKVEDILAFLTARILDQFGLDSGGMQRWTGK